MPFLASLLGPKSKYDASLPYTYEARVPIFDDGEYKSYFSDTVCGLIAHLEDRGIRPQQAHLLEIYRERETPIDAALLANEAGGWLTRPELCRSFAEHYKGHIHPDTCSFKDRDRAAF